MKKQTITKQAENYLYRIPNQGLTLATTLLVAVLSLTAYSFLQLDFTALVFAQEQNNNPSPSTSTVAGDTNTTTSNLNSTQIDFVYNIEQIKGHLNAAMLNKENGNDTLALAHAFHPVAEVYTIIGPTIANANTTLNDTLSAELYNIPDTVASDSEFSRAIQNAKLLLNQTIDTVIPTELKDNLTFNTKVVIDLPTVAENEYEEAVANNTIAEIVEYQDAQAFISRGIDRAESLFERASIDIPENMSESVQRVRTMFTDLKNNILINAYPGMSISNPESVGSTIQKIVLELSEIRR